MEEQKKNIEQFCKNVSDNILDSKVLIEILEDIIDGDNKLYTILRLIESNLDKAFDNIEECRSYISVPD